MDKDGLIRLVSGWVARLIAKGLAAWLLIDAATAQSEATQIANALATLVVVGVNCWQEYHAHKATVKKTAEKASP